MKIQICGYYINKHLESLLPYNILSINSSVIMFTVSCITNWISLNSLHQIFMAQFLHAQTGYYSVFYLTSTQVLLQQLRQNISILNGMKINGSDLFVVDF